MRPFVLGIDPGKITGWALWGPDDQVGFRTGEADFMEVCHVIWTLTTTFKTDLDVVCEKFMIGPQTHKKTPAPWSLEVTGVAKFFTMEYTGRELKGYQPQAAKSFGTLERLKALGWHVPTKDGHGDDAARQILLYLVENGWWDDRIGPKSI